MRSDLLIIRNKIFAFLACVAFIVLMMGMVYVDVHWMNDAVHETSFTEVAQELILAIIALMFFMGALKYSNFSTSLVLISGFFTCMLIREMDFLFDMIRHGAWVWFALTITALSLSWAAFKPAKTLAGLVHLLQHPAWNMLCAGLLTILVFSRLFGMTELWQQLMLDGYNRTVKNMAEEGSELLGYSFCLFASVRYLWDIHHQYVKARTVDFQLKN